MFASIKKSKRKTFRVYKYLNRYDIIKKEADRIHLVASVSFIFHSREE